MERLLSSKRKDSECFPVSIVVCEAFLVRELPETASKGLEGMLLDGVANTSAIVDFSSLLLV